MKMSRVESKLSLIDVLFYSLSFTESESRCSLWQGKRKNVLAILQTLVSSCSKSVTELGQKNNEKKNSKSHRKKLWWNQTPIIIMKITGLWSNTQKNTYDWTSDSFKGK